HEGGPRPQRLEAFLLDYDGADLYGERLRLEFLERLRDERRFESAEALVAQVHEDVRRVRELAGAAPAPPRRGHPPPQDPALPFAPRPRVRDRDGWAALAGADHPQQPDHRVEAILAVGARPEPVEDRRSRIGLQAGSRPRPPRGPADRQPALGGVLAPVGAHK